MDEDKFTCSSFSKRTLQTVVSTEKIDALLSYSYEIYFLVDRSVADDSSFFYTAQQLLTDNTLLNTLQTLSPGLGRIRKSLSFSEVDQDKPNWENSIEITASSYDFVIKGLSLTGNGFIYAAILNITELT